MKLKHLKILVLGLNYLLLVSQVWGQVTVTNKGVAITNIRSSIYFNGNYIHDSTSSIANGGTIYFRNDVTNVSDNGVLVTDAGKVIIDGKQQQNIFGNTPVDFYKLEINKPSGDLVLSQNIAVKDTLLLRNGNINLNGKEIDLGATGELVNETENKRVFGLTGKIKATRYIDHPALSENIAGLGLSVSADAVFSYVLIERSHEQQTFNGDTSIFRYYNFIPLNSGTTGLIDSLKFSYFDSEMIQGEYLYKVFASTNDGVMWNNKGGLVDTTGNFVITTTITPPELGKFRTSVFPIESFATCLPNDPDFISAVFLVSTSGINGDTIKFVQFTDSISTDYSWNFGDGYLSTEFSPIHIYNLPDPSEPNEYQVSMTVTNGVCSDTRKKRIMISPKPGQLKIGGLFSGIEYFNIYPNPNSGAFNIEVKTTDQEDISISISDMQGRPLKSKRVTSTKFKDEFSLEEYNSGMYYIRLQVRDEVRVIKMVKF